MDFRLFWVICAHNNILAILINVNLHVDYEVGPLSLKNGHEKRKVVQGILFHFFDMFMPCKFAFYIQKIKNEGGIPSYFSATEL